MPKDYAKYTTTKKQAPRKYRRAFWLFLIALVVGSCISGVGYQLWKHGGAIFKRDAHRAAQIAKTLHNLEKEIAEDADGKVVETQFDFYTTLPKLKVLVDPK